MILLAVAAGCAKQSSTPITGFAVTRVDSIYLDNKVNITGTCDPGTDSITKYLSGDSKYYYTGFFPGVIRPSGTTWTDYVIFYPGYVHSIVYTEYPSKKQIRLPK